jgi:hypothetical protein
MSNNGNNNSTQTETINADTFVKTIMDVILEEIKKLTIAAQKSEDKIKLLSSIRRLINENQIENHELCEKLLEMVNLAKTSEKKTLREATREFDRFIVELNTQIEANYVPSATKKKRQSISDNVDSDDEEDDHFESRKRNRYFIEDEEEDEDEYDSVDLGDASDMDDDDDDDDEYEDEDD